MKYKVGDKVKVRSDLKTDVMYGSDSFVDKMEPMKGKVVTIESVGTYDYRIKGFGYSWTDEMFEGLASDPKRMKAYELMAKAAAEPEKYEGKKYEVVDGVVRDFGGNGLCELYVRNGKLCKPNGVPGEYAYISTGAILEEIKPEPKPVSFIEAINSGKPIMPVEGKLWSYCYAKFWLGMMAEHDRDSSRLANHEKYINGQWLIKEDE